MGEINVRKSIHERKLIHGRKLINKRKSINGSLQVKKQNLTGATVFVFNRVNVGKKYQLRFTVHVYHLIPRCTLYCPSPRMATWPVDGGHVKSSLKVRASQAGDGWEMSLGKDFTCATLHSHSLRHTGSSSQQQPRTKRPSYGWQSQPQLLATA